MLRDGLSAMRVFLCAGEAAMRGGGAVGDFMSGPPSVIMRL